MIKRLALTTSQCFGPFSKFPVDGSSQTGLFRHLSNHVFRGTLFRKFISYESYLFLKGSKFNIDLKNVHKNSENFFCFFDNCIWIVCIELSLLRREYLSSTVNVLRKSLNLSISLRVTFSNSITFTVTCKYSKYAGVEIESVFWPVSHVACQCVISNETF